MDFWSWLRGVFGDAVPHSDDDSAPLLAIVLLLREPRDLDAHEIANLATHALDIPIVDSLPLNTDYHVAGEAPSFVLRLGPQMFMVNAFPRPYMDDPEAASAEIPELRLRKAVREHGAWISVDLVGDCEPNDLADVYRTLGKLTAELVDENCLALFAPATCQLVVFDLEMRERLRGDRPLDLFDQPAHPPVVPVSGDDPRLKAAVSRARRRWPEFVAAFEERRPEQMFSVKARIGRGDDCEFMWLTVTGLEHGFIYGRLDNDPIELTNIRCGDRVRVAERDLNDWLFSDGLASRGGFTIDVLRRIQAELRPE